MEFLKEVIFAIAGGSGFAALDWKTVVMLVIACVLLYMGIGKGFEPLLLVPIAFGMLLANLPLTGLFNERYFSRVLNICEEKKLPFVLYYLDLDRFKPINDTYGHLMGDRLLKEIAARLLRCIRSRDYAFRIGGDEFALIVSADMDEGQRARMAERIQTTLSAPVVLDGTELSVGVSCGCACYPEDGSASQVRIAADSRMYETKQRHHENDRTEGES